LVQRNALMVWEGDADFKALLKKDKAIGKVLGKKEIDDLFDLSHHLAHIHTIFERVFHE